MNDIAQAQQRSAIDQELGNKIGRMLVNRGKITKEEFKAIIAVQNEQDLRFGEAAMMLGLIDAADIKSVLVEQFSYTALPASNSVLSRKLFAIFQPDSPQAESLRSLRSELLLRYFNKGAHLSLAIVGSEDAQEIALTTANLAISFAQLGIRTLLIDGNLRAPQLHKLFGVSERDPGLADVIAGRALINPAPLSPLNSLYLLPAGTEVPNPQELLAHRLCAEKLQALSADFDVTLISTSPLTNTLDAQLVAANTGAALVVVQENISRLKDVEAICNSLRGLGVRLLGAALRQ